MNIDEKQVNEVADRFTSAFESTSKNLMRTDFAIVVERFKSFFPVFVPVFQEYLDQWTDHDSIRKFFRDAAREDAKSEVLTNETYPEYMALSFTLTEVLRAGFICGERRLPRTDAGGRPPNDRKERIKAYFLKRLDAGDTESVAAKATAIRYQTTRETVFRLVRQDPIEAKVLEIRMRLRKELSSEKS